MELLDNLIIQQRKEQIVSRLQTVVDATREEIQSSQDSLSLEKETVSKLIQLVQQEAPELSDPLKIITDVYYKALDADKNLLDSKLRSIEDLNDIQERFTVVVRQSMKYSDAKSALESATNSLQSAQKKYDNEVAKAGSNIAKLSSKVADATTAKNEAIKNLKAETLKYIEEKQKFNAFRTRRMKSSYLTLGKGQKESMNTSAELYNQMKGLVTEAKGNVDGFLHTPDKETA